MSSNRFRKSSSETVLHDQGEPSPLRSVVIWGLAIRLFHLLLILAIIGMWYTAEVGAELDFPMVWHARLGYCVIGLVAFRVIWGLVGSGHARFSRFVASPRMTWRYAADFLAGRAPRHAGHNPLGGWMTLAILLVLAIQASSGLFLTDDLLFEGPLHDRVPASVAEGLAWVHHTNITLLWGLIALHLMAIVWHGLRGEWLIWAMVHGRKHFRRDESVVDEGEPVPPLRPRRRLALGLAIGIAVLVIWQGAQLP